MKATAVAENYKAVFTQHRNSVKDAREALETKRLEESDIKGKLAEANAFIKSVNADFKAFRLLHNGYYHVNKAAGKAANESQS